MTTIKINGTNCIAEDLLQQRKDLLDNEGLPDSTHVPAIVWYIIHIPTQKLLDTLNEKHPNIKVA